MPLVAFCLRHFSADFIICTCEFEFRQAQGYSLGFSICGVVTLVGGIIGLLFLRPESQRVRFDLVKSAAVQTA